LPLRANIAHWSGIDFDAFAMALINADRPSFGADGRLVRRQHEIGLNRRSAYLMTGGNRDRRTNITCRRSQRCAAR
jgi:hypothetical protein